MRIVLVNWARIWEGAAEGGGVNQYVQALALELVKRGHDVVSLCGGTSHTPPSMPILGSGGGRDSTAERAGLGIGTPPLPPPPPTIRRHHDWFGIKVFEVFNSPVLAPSLAQFERPLDEVSSPALERVVAEFFNHLRPAVVHWNNLEGFSIGCVAAARGGWGSAGGGEAIGANSAASASLGSKTADDSWSGARSVFSLHNYHTICPQVYFMQGHRAACHSYDNGHACATCVKVVPWSEERDKHVRRTMDALTQAGGGAPGQPNRRQHAVAEMRQALSWLPRSLRAGATWTRAVLAGEPSRTAAVPTLAGRLVRGVDDATGSFPLPGPTRTLSSPSGLLTLAENDRRGPGGGGGGPHLLAELNPPAKPDLSLPQFRPLSNEIVPEPQSAKIPNDYAKRRRAMVEMLNSCDRVLAVSSFVRDKFVSMGVTPDVIRTQAIGSRINRVVALKPELPFAPPKFLRPPVPEGIEQRPVRLLFMGFNNYYKGLAFYAEALEELEASVLGKLRLTVFALDGHSIEWMFRRLEPRLAGLKYGYQYHYHDIPWFSGGQDMIVVPSVWWDNGPQTVFEAFGCGVPVLGAAVGGIPDFVRHGENGLLFRGNDREDLKNRLREITREPWRIDDLRANVRPPKSIEEHAIEMERLYAGEDDGGER